MYPFSDDIIFNYARKDKHFLIFNNNCADEEKKISSSVFHNLTYFQLPQTAEVRVKTQFRLPQAAEVRVKT
jgi:hypothetical protein